MNGERAEKKGHEKTLSRKPCPVQKFLGLDRHFAKKNFWHRLRRRFSRELEREVEDIVI